LQLHLRMFRCRALDSREGNRLQAAKVKGNDIHHGDAEGTEKN
jgi:hypothetical protein